MTRPEFERGWVVLTGALPTTEIPASTKELYWSALEEHDGQRFITGILNLVQDEDFRNDRVPTIAQLKPPVVDDPIVLTPEQVAWREAYFKRYHNRGGIE